MLTQPDQPVQFNRGLAAPAVSTAAAPANLRPTRRAPELIERPLLLRRLDQIRRLPLALVQAPAGYSKTTLLTQYFDQLEQDGLFPAWLTLNASHGDMYGFYTALAGALAGCGVPLSLNPPSTALARSFNLEAMLSHLEGSLASAPRDVYLFLDDAQYLAATPALALLAALVERSPLRLHLLVATRCKLALPVARLRQQDLLLEVEAAQLQFNAEETTALLQQGGHGGVNPAFALRLREQCEGWPGALVLLRGMLRAAHGAGVQDVLARFSGERRQVADFFKEQVLPAADEDEAIRSFLTVTSVAGRICPDLCNVLTGRSDGRAMLSHCEDMGMFVVRLDEERNWYRYHHLFAQFLRRELRDSDAEAEQALHRRAGQWLFEQKQFVDAFEHALAVADPLWGAQILDFWCRYEFGASAPFEILTLAARLPDQVKSQFPRVMLLEAWRRDVFWQFEGSRELLSMSRARLQMMEAEAAAPPDELNAIRGLLLHGEMMIACCSDDMPRTEELSHILIRDYERANLHVRGSFYTSLLYAQREQYKLGDIDRLSRQGRSHFNHTGKTMSTVFHEAVVGPSHFMAGRSEVAIHGLSDAMETAIRLTGKGSPLAALAALPLSEIHYERNELVQACALLNEYLPLMTTHGFVDQMIAAWTTQARILRLEGKGAQAAKLLEESIGFAREHGFERLRMFAVAMQIKHALGDGQIDEALRMGRAHGIHGPARQFLPSGALTTRDEGRALSWARLAIAENRLADAMTVAKQWHSFLETAGAVRNVIRWDIVQASALMLSGERRAAQRALRRAIGIAASGRFIRVFLDEGPWLQALLQDQGGGPGLPDQPGDAFGTELLALFEQNDMRAGFKTVIPETSGNGVFGALGTREMDILRLMGAGMLNREIGEKLGMTEGSVKWYVQQIYDKIGVRRRAQVVERAFQLGLISR